MQKQTLRVGGVPEHFNAPWHQALAADAFLQSGLNLSFTEYPTGTGAMCQDLRAGVLDVAVVLTEGIVADIVRHGGSRIIAPYVDVPLVWGIHVGAQSAIQTLDDLRGRPFAISREGSGSQLMAQLLAQELGWNPETELSFEVVGGIAPLEAAVTSGNFGAFLWEKFTTKPRVDAGVLRRIGEYPTPWPCFMLAANEAVLATRREELDTMLSVLYQQTAAFMQNPEAAIALVSERYHIQPEDTREWWKDVNWATDSQLPLSELEHTLKTLQQVGILAETPCKVTDLVFAREASRV